MNDDVPPLATRLDLRDRHVAVTRAPDGLGLAICHGLLEFGAVVLDRATFDRTMAVNLRGALLRHPGGHDPLTAATRPTRRPLAAWPWPRSFHLQA